MVIVLVTVHEAGSQLMPGQMGASWRGQGVGGGLKLTGDASLATEAGWDACYSVSECNTVFWSFLILTFTPEINSIQPIKHKGLNWIVIAKILTAQCLKMRKPNFSQRTFVSFMQK